MSSSSWRRHTRSLLSIDPSPPRLLGGLKAAGTMAVPLSLGQASGHLSLGLLATLGTFTILYGAGAPARLRARLLALVGAGLTATVTLGVVTAGRPVLTVMMLVLVAMAACFVCVALYVGPPGSYFFVLVAGVADLAVSHGAAPGAVVAVTAGGAACAWVVGMSDLLVAPHRPEAQAVAAAQEAVSRLEQEDTPPQDAAATAALHRAWTAVTDGGSRPAYLAQVREVHARWAAVLARHADRHLGGGDAGATEPTVDELDLEQVRDSSLGRPDAGYLLAQAARHPSEVLQVVTRVGLACAAAGALALGTHRGHAYWAVAFAALVLSQGGTRAGLTLRGVQRGLGTLVGLGAFALLLTVRPSGWWVVALVCLLQLVIELVVVRNYALAVVFITPLALTIATASTPGGGVGPTLLDRSWDTLIGIGCALVVTWTTGRRRPAQVLRAHARRVVEATDRVLAGLAAGEPGSPRAVADRRHLYHELLECETVARRALADAPDAVAEHHRLARAVSTLGYAVLGAAWHPDLRSAREAFEQARAPLGRIMATPVTRPRPVRDVERDVADVRAVVAALR